MLIEEETRPVSAEKTGARAGSYGTETMGTAGDRVQADWPITDIM